MSFVEISPQWLATSAEGVRDDVHLYWKGSKFAQKFMWDRLRVLSSDIVTRAPKGGEVIDVGGGLGLLLPTLASHFSKVSLLDLNTVVARKVVQKYNLNIDLIEDNFLTYTSPKKYDAAVAAAFLEHFQDTEAPVLKLKELLKPGGLLFIDVPTENIIYQAGRLVGNITKPADHYHGAAEIVPIIEKHFRILSKKTLPYPVLPLFLQVVAEPR